MPGAQIMDWLKGHRGKWEVLCQAAAAFWELVSFVVQGHPVHGHQIGQAEVPSALSTCARGIRYSGTRGKHCFHLKRIIHNKLNLLLHSLSEMPSLSRELSVGHIHFLCGTMWNKAALLTRFTDTKTEEVMLVPADHGPSDLPQVSEGGSSITRNKSRLIYAWSTGSNPQLCLPAAVTIPARGWGVNRELGCCMLLGEAWGCPCRECFGESSAAGAKNERNKWNEILAEQGVRAGSVLSEINRVDVGRLCSRSPGV